MSTYKKVIAIAMCAAFIGLVPENGVGTREKGLHERRDAARDHRHGGGV